MNIRVVAGRPGMLPRPGRPGWDEDGWGNYTCPAPGNERAKAGPPRGAIGTSVALVTPFLALFARNRATGRPATCTAPAGTARHWWRSMLVWSHKIDSRSIDLYMAERHRSLRFHRCEFGLGTRSNSAHALLPLNSPAVYTRSIP
jgi:hypothetical protein